MRVKTILLSLLLLMTLLAAFFGTRPQYIRFLLSPPWAGPCDPSTEEIEMNTRLTKGLGIGHTPPDMHCSVFCLQVPEGSELVIGIADLDYQLSFHVGRDLYPNWDPGLPPNPGMIVGNKKIIGNPRTKIMNPIGRYYIYICPGEDFGEFWIDEGRCTPTTFKGSTLFTIHNKFTP